jgi:hypothetical protein
VWMPTKKEHGCVKRHWLTQQRKKQKQLSQNTKTL